MGRKAVGDIEIVGIVEPNRDLAKQYSDLHGYSMDLVYNTIEEMVEATHPEAVTAFNMIYDHLKVVEYCAPRGIHAMVEKPLAVSYEHAEKMIALAKKHNIHLLTNYETSWYGSSTEAYKLIHESKKITDLRKIVFHTGHPGPIEIGCNEEFLEWLTDPILNGGGALTDFGCYGANLATWLMNGSVPTTVSCVTQQIKPELYPKVEDEATIILTYPKTQVIIQASWNWSHNRKDMEIYGKSSYIICKNGQDMEVMESEKAGVYSLTAAPLPKGIDDPFAYLHKVVKENYVVEPFGLASVENNKIVIQILEAAKHAAKTGETVVWADFFKSIYPGHAHNDYENKHPLYDALDNGFISIEADVHLIDDQLYVAHNRPKNPTPALTLEAMYLNPLKKYIQENNGFVYPNYSGPFYLMIDIKTAGKPTYEKLKSILANYTSILSTYQHGEAKAGPVKVLISGNRPIADILNDDPKLVALDGRPKDLDNNIPASFMPVVSDNYKHILSWTGEGQIKDTERQKLKELVTNTHAQGKQLRLWASPDNPTVWKFLLDNGVDLINTDLVEGFRRYFETK
ncbi:MAG: hypothetical protein DHS20C18_47380 [Saprospiraceae bacterium]|nr:MAG: hypothetical protein DHS20C18_47380 [Saprospiraceae bacterium]